MEVSTAVVAVEVSTAVVAVTVVVDTDNRQLTS
ncbi:hypothetical protein HDF08_002124 [Edaphobacter lichenicola]|uniref:Uncharacterized protein n=1 Tax=Tunturiibacter lichenicola TaxID=2051959 RepID=A0A852VER3_9BACT|nr:hypothetical protein [Edaphobacter lichenicola]